MGALTCRGVRRSARTAAVPGHPLTPSRPPAPAPGRGAVPGGGARRDRGRWPGTVAFAEDVLPSQPRPVSPSLSSSPTYRERLLPGPARLPGCVSGHIGVTAHARVRPAFFVLRFSPGKGPRHATVRRVPVAEAAGARPPRAPPPAAAVGRGSAGSFVVKHVLPWTSIIVTPSFQHLLLPHKKAEW